MLITSSVDYVRWTQTTALYLDKIDPDDEDKKKEYELLGAVDEIGEIAGMLKRVIRDSNTLNMRDFGLELGDLAWYLARIHYDHADSELTAGNNLFPIVEKLGYIDDVKGLTCFDIAIKICEHLKQHFIDSKSAARYIFGPRPKSIIDMVKQMQDGFMSTAQDPLAHFVFTMNKRIEDSAVIGILLHMASELHSMEAILDWCSLCYRFNFDILDILQSNVNKLESRKERGTLHGKGSSR